MKKLILLAGIAALCACSSQEPAAEDTAAEAAAAPAAAMAADGLPAAGDYTITNAEKETGSLAVAADGTYAFTTDEGTIKGAVTAKDGKACYDPEGDKEPAMCWTSAKPGADGSWTATSDDGQTVTAARKAA